MTTRHTLLFRLIGPMQAWGYRSRFEDRDTALEPTRSGVLGLLASACGIARGDTDTLTRWDETLHFGVRVDLPAIKKNVFEANKNPETRPLRSGFRVETDFHTAQDVLRAAGKGLAETVLSRRHYLTDARYTVGVEGADLSLLEGLEDRLKNPVWTLSLGRKSFPLALPPWLPGGGIRENTMLLDALKAAPFPLLSVRETLPEAVTFVIEADVKSLEILPENAIPMRLADRPLDFDARRYGLREARIFRETKENCGMEEDRCFYQK